MLIRRRSFLAYSGLGIVFVWSIFTYYLTFSRPADMTVADDRRAALNNRINKLETDILRQKAEHERLRDLLTKSASDQEVLSALPETIGPIAVVVFACNRPNAIRNHLDQLLKLRPSKEQFPIIVSQDCMHADTTEAVKSYGDQVIFIQHPDQRDIVLPPKQKKFVGYYKISRHYRWALNQTFFTHGFNAAIITEDDLDIAADFFDYFTATYKLLASDPSLWCVSAWNDNGKTDMIDNKPELLYRTDFFPGLGWMLTRKLWEELEPIWPEAFWDDWMRRPEQRKQRACIRPEIPRTAMSSHGKVGVSRGLYFDKHLKMIKLNSQSVAFTKMDLSFLLKDKYDEEFVKRVYSCPSITLAELMSGNFADGKKLPPSVRITYADKTAYKNTAKSLKLMDDFRAGVPRTAYRGVVPFMYGKTRVFLAPLPDWKGYDVTWS